MIAAGGLVGGAGLMIFNALWETTLQSNIPEAALSRVSAYDWFGSLAFRPVGLVLVGPIAAAIGDAETLLVAGILQVLSMLVLLAVPDVRRLRAREAEAAAQSGPRCLNASRTATFTASASVGCGNVVASSASSRPSSTCSGVVSAGSMSPACGATMVPPSSLPVGRSSTTFTKPSSSPIARALPSWRRSLAVAQRRRGRAPGPAAP